MSVEMDLDEAMTKALTERPIIIGIFGVSGSGKTYYMNQVKAKLGENRFKYYDGSQVIGSIVEGGLDAFKAMSTDAKKAIRERAILKIKQDASNEWNHASVVTGHYALWEENVMTDVDREVYSRIIYLDTSADNVVEYAKLDTSRARPILTSKQIFNWQTMEKTALQRIALDHGILFTVIQPDASTTDQLAEHIGQFAYHCARLNQLVNNLWLSTAYPTFANAKIILTIDADKTLAPVDTGSLLYKRMHPFAAAEGKDPLKDIFSSKLGYSYEAFRQAVYFWKSEMDTEVGKSSLDWVADNVTVYPEMNIWSKIIKKLNLPRDIYVLGCDVSRGIIVNTEVKGEAVKVLREKCQKMVYAFGDSTLDIEMLENANEAFIIVPHDKQLRSKSMIKAVETLIDQKSFKAHQIYLSTTEKPQFDINVAKLPSTTLSSLAKVIAGKAITARVHAHTDTGAAKLLMIPTRDANIYGTQLREAHRAVGRYLTLTSLTEVIGLEEYNITHVQAKPTIGYKIKDDKEITIIACMRGGEPLASGVSDILSSAMFVHARDEKDVKDHHIAGQSTILVVDTVINSGKTSIEFIDAIRKMSADVHIVLVATVVQDGAVKSDGTLGKAMMEDEKVDLVALRLSQNKYTGSKQSDTGNRLFNTTHLE